MLIFFFRNVNDAISSKSLKTTYVASDAMQMAHYKLTIIIIIFIIITWWGM